MVPSVSVTVGLGEFDGSVLEAVGVTVETGVELGVEVSEGISVAVGVELGEAVTVIVAVDV